MTRQFLTKAALHLQTWSPINLAGNKNCRNFLLRQFLKK
jgi:hypothetical protein